MVLVKIAAVGAALIALMAVAQNQRWPQRAGVVGACVATQPPAYQQTGAWYACTQGILTSFPSLGGESCDSIGFVRDKEIWRCDAPLVSLPGY